MFGSDGLVPPESPKIYGDQHLGINWVLGPDGCLSRNPWVAIMEESGFVEDVEGDDCYLQFFQEYMLLLWTILSKLLGRSSHLVSG